MAKKNWGQIIGFKILLVINIIFALVGLGVLIAAIVSWNKVEEVRGQADVLEDMDLSAIVTVVLFTSCGTILTALIGLLGVFQKNKKIIMIYMLFCFVVAVIQLAAGVIMFQLDPSNVRNSFREDSAEGAARRQRFQNYMKCCGWGYITEEFFPERVACIALNPTYTSTCLNEIHNFINTWIIPAAAALVSTACLLIVGLGASVVVVFTNKQVKENFLDNAFTA